MTLFKRALKIDIMPIFSGSEFDFYNELDISKRV